MAGEANPLDATYFANLAALNFQKENALASDKRGREQTNANALYSKGQLTRAEPLRLTANRSTANSQGLLESGQLAQRQGQTQTEYASKQARVGETRKSAIERYNEGDATANKSYLLGQQKAESESFARAKTTAENETKGTTTAGEVFPIPYAQQEAIAKGVQPGPGGVVPYESGKVRVGLPLRPNPSEVRRSAAKKATGVG